MARRVFKKKSMRKRRAPKKRSMKRRAKSGRSSANKDVFKTKITINGVLSPSQGVVATNYIQVWVSLLNAQSGVLNVTQSPEFATWRQIYDRFRVHGVSMTLKPRYKTSEVTAALIAGGSAVPLVTNSGNNMVFSAVDRDGKTPSSIDQLMKYSSHKKASIYTTHRRGYGVKYAKDIWFDAQNIAANSVLASAVGALGCIGIYAENVPEFTSQVVNPIWYDVEISWNLSFQGKVMNPTVSNTGAVTLEQPLAAAYLTASTFAGIGNYSNSALPLDIAPGLAI